MRLVGALGSFVLVACTVHLDPPRDARISCRSRLDCPAELACLADIGFCTRRDASCVDAGGDELRARDDGTACSRDDGSGGVCGSGVCRPSFCGDAIVDPQKGEQCDAGAENADDLPDACRTSCRAASCGDGVLDPIAMEACDDGNGIDGDGCDHDCSATGCQNGIITLGEECDDGNASDGDGCDHNCTSTRCGNAVPTGAEVCDDGNNASGDGCNAICTSIELCGNAVVDSPTETCDLASQNSNTANAFCRVDCLTARCGDGILDDARGEACDGVAHGAESCSTFGFYRGALACSAECHYDLAGCSGRCGDAVLDAADGELCDNAPPPADSCLKYGFDAGELQCGPACAPKFDRCRFAGWALEETNVAANFTGVWSATGGTFAVAVGPATYAMHRAAGQWSPVSTGTIAYLNDVFGFSATNVYAVGEAGTVLHYAGASWQNEGLAPGPNLAAVHGSAPNNLFAVGDGGTVVHYDGSWTSSSIAAGVQLTGVWAFSATNAIAVGVTGPTGVAYRYNGSGWAPEPGFPTVLNVRDIFARAANDIFVPHRDGVLHFDGVSWQDSLILNGSAFNSISGTAAGAHVVGDAGRSRWFDGEGWVALAMGSTRFFAGVHAADDSHVFAVGFAGEIRMFDGADVGIVESSGMFNCAAGVYAASMRDVYYMCSNALARRVGTTILLDFTPSVEWRGVSGTAASNVIAVGIDNSGPPAGVARRYTTGPAWAALAPPPLLPEGVYTWSTAGAVAVGAAGKISEWNGATWNGPVAPSGQDLLAVHGSAQSFVVAVGANGSVVHGTPAFAPVAAPTTSTLRGVFVFSPTSAYAVGDGGVILRWNGSAWSIFPSGVTTNLASVWAANCRRSG